MRVLHVIDSLESGGAEHSLASVLPALTSLGVDGSVVHFGQGSGLTDRIEAEGTGVSRLLAAGRVARVRQLAGLVERERPDLVHTTLFEADVAGRLAARRRGVPVVSSLVTMQYGPERRAGEGLPAWKVAAARALDTGTAQLVTRFHAITRAAATHAARRLRVGRKPIEVIPRGRSGDALGTRALDRRTRVRAALGWGADTSVLLAVARQEPQKGLDVLLRALARLPDGRRPRLALAGRAGNASPHLLRLIVELGLEDRVDQLGVRDDIADLMVGADVLVLPSRWEGLGGVLIEAMALELPIVASDLEPVAEVAPHGDVALLVPPDDDRSLADAIAAVLADPAGAADRTRRGRARFEASYTIEAVAEQMAGFYERALTGDPPRQGGRRGGRR